MKAAPSTTPSPIKPTPTLTLTPTPTPTLPPATGEDDVPMVEVPVGEFIMGISREQADRWFYSGDSSLKSPSLVYNQVPQLRVHLDTFFIDQLEVTNARYRQCVEAGVCLEPPRLVISDYLTNPQYDHYPAVATWDQARTYCHWVGKQLSTEAEWEKAARGTDGRLYPWGDEWDEQRANATEALAEFEPVGQRLEGASPYGVLNMGDNVAEWVADGFAPYPGNKVELNFSPRLNARISRGTTGPTGSTVYRDTSDSVAGIRCVQGPEPKPLEESIVQILTHPTPEPARKPDLSQAAYVPAGEFIMGANDTL